ncbi:11005_t:CDS:2 [Gigaspora margarita]|uniref:11005_t:CDS:1 n=1 Tax=Gigaspora margarita TaxID=4874 RepID=A0ABN7VAV5_GIGMA|nr:11005_t:CDS:2 [Gigaspora margarita]
MSSDEFLPSYLRHSPINKYKKNAYKPILLPTHWNSMDCWPYINIMDDDNLKLKYNGVLESDTASQMLDLIHYQDGFQTQSGIMEMMVIYSVDEEMEKYLDLVTLLGIQLLVGEMYPMCGMAINGECIVTNFGSKPFIFDIDNYAEAIFAGAESKERT